MIRAELNKPVENARFDGFSDSYHRLGPVIDLSQEEVVKVISHAAIELMGPNFHEMMQSPTGFSELTDNQRTDLSSMFRDLADAALLKSRSESADPSGDLARAESMYELSARVLATKTPGIADMCSIDEVKLMTNTLKGVDQDRSEYRLLILRRLLEGRQMRSQELYDGVAYEYAFVMAAQYYYWAKEIEGLDNGCRLARTREDMPARGMKPDQGTRVAHDAILTHNGEVYRIQTKFGVQMLGYQDRYDHSVIRVIAEENMTGEDLNNFIQDVREAYRGDSLCSARVIAKVESYLAKIIDPAKVIKDFAGGLLLSA
jgi:hypothetical protein